MGVPTRSLTTIRNRMRLLPLLSLRELRHRPAPAVLLMIAVATATTTLTVAQALGSVADAPWDRTRTQTAGPDVWVRARAGVDLTPVMRAPGVVEAAPQRSHYRVNLDGGSGPVAALVQVRDTPEGSFDRPSLVGGRWAGPGEIVVERAFADALGVGPGDSLRLQSRTLSVSGVAVTTARAPYPSNAPGLTWVTPADDDWLRAAATGTFVSVALRLTDPDAAPAFAASVMPSGPTTSPVFAQPWQMTRDFTIADQRLTKGALMIGAWTLALLAIAGAAVLASGGAERARRRAGLLKAVGAAPGLVTAVLMAGPLLAGVVAGLVGVLAGRLVAPALARPSAGLLDVPLTVSLTATDILAVLALAALITCCSAGPTAWRAARASTSATLTAPVRHPRRLGPLIRVSAWLPPSWLIGVRLAARRPGRSLAATLSLTITVAMVVAALAMRHHTEQRGSRTLSGIEFVPGAGNPVIDRLDEVTTTVMVALLALAAVNTVLIGWAGVLDFLRGTALLRAVGASGRQITAGIMVANLAPAALAGLFGIPVGLGVFRLAARLAGSSRGELVPPASWLAPVPLVTVAVVTLLMIWPALAGSRRPVASVLAAE